MAELAKVEPAVQDAKMGAFYLFSPYPPPPPLPPLKKVPNFIL